MMKKRVITGTVIWMFLVTSMSADLLNSLIWAGTKAAGRQIIQQNMGGNSHRTTSTHKKRHKSKKSRKKVVVYHCSAKALRASGWTESTSLSKAKRGAIKQCKIRRVSNKPCVIQNCYKK